MVFGCSAHMALGWPPSHCSLFCSRSRSPSTAVKSWTHKQVWNVSFVFCLRLNASVLPCRSWRHTPQGSTLLFLWRTMLASGKNGGRGNSHQNQTVTEQSLEMWLKSQCKNRLTSESSVKKQNKKKQPPWWFRFKCQPDCAPRPLNKLTVTQISGPLSPPGGWLQ